MFACQALHKTFRVDNREISVLKDINLSIEQGEIFGIIGLSGAGKSTLIRCLNRLEQPSSGQVLFDGVDLAKLQATQLHRVRQRIGMIFQDFHLFAQRSVLKNVSYPLEISGVKPKVAEQKAKELLALVGIAEKINTFPARLSGGQKQRVAIARALATSPAVLLCDEATSALDPNTTDSILTLLKHINKTMGVTIVLVTHEMAVIQKICDRVAVLDHGHVVELATVEALFKNPTSTIAKNFVLPKQSLLEPNEKCCYRIVFDGNASHQPIVAGMVLSCNAMVNIIYANTKDVDGKAYGEMLLQLPDDAEIIARIEAYLKGQSIFYKRTVAGEEDTSGR